MAKLPCVGSVFYQKVSGTYTAIGQVKSVSLDGIGGKAVDTDCFDSAADNNSQVWSEKTTTGFADPGSCTASIFLDPTLSGHQNLVATAFVANLWKLLYAGTTGLFDLFGSACHTCGRKVDVGQVFMMDLKTENSGPVTQFS